MEHLEQIICNTRPIYFPKKILEQYNREFGTTYVIIEYITFFVSTFYSDPRFDRHLRELSTITTPARP
jgi:hypothetical protein